MSARLCLILLVALSAACGGGGSDSGSSGASSTSPPPPPPTNSGIGSAGGTVTEASGAKVVIPAGALTANTNIAVTESSSGAPPLPAGVTAFGSIYAFTPHGTTFATPVTITVPFDPAKVPAGTTVVLYKTNASQTAWEPVSGATVSGNTIVGNVSGFSFGVAATQITPTKLEWSVDGFTEGSPKPVHLVPADDKEKHSCIGCFFDVNKLVGDPQVVVAPGLHLKVDDPSYWVFSDEFGEHFGSWSIAPHADRVTADSFIGLHNTVKLTYTFKANQDHPTLNFLITILRLEGFDSSGAGPNRFACPWLSATPTAAELKDCRYWMSGLEATVKVQASSFSGPFYTIGGTVTVGGMRQNWEPKIWRREAEHMLWKDGDLIFDSDVDGDGGSHAHEILAANKPIPIPLSQFKKDDVFQVEVTMETRAVNFLQNESFILALFRDPLQGTGIATESTGLTQIEQRDDIPTTLPPISCTTGVDPAAGVLQFSSPTYTVPERVDRAEIAVERTGGTTGPVSVHVATADATAQADDDYDAVSTDLRFADGEGGQALIEVPLRHDTVAEDDETVTLVLSGVGGCATLGTQSTATLKILDNDRPLPPPQTHTISGAVTGLTGSGLVLRNVLSGGSVSPTNGPFTLPDALVDGQNYDVRVDTQPSNPIQQCTVTNGTGTIAGADITNVQVTCVGLAPSGSLDPTFGTSGRVITNISAFSSNVFNSRMGMALQSDGRILIAGGLTLVRFNSDGSLDSTFGTGGQAHVPFDGGSFDGAEDLAVQPDGKIVVVGVTDPGGQIGKDDFALARFNSDGTLDQSFGTGGKTSTDIAGNTDIARRVRIQPDGKIVVAGHAIVQAAPSVFVQEFALVRYNANGTPDATFSRGGSGKVRDSAGRSFNDQRGLVIQSDGKILLAGITADNGAAAPTDAGLVRYWGDVHPGSVVAGDRDETFGALNNGTVESDLQLVSPDVDDALVTADGTVFVAGHAVIGGSARFILAPFSGDGRLAGGAQITQFSDQGDFANGMLQQADGKIVVVGQSANLASNADMAIVRYAGSGAAFAPDASFGTDGKVTVDFFGGRDNAFAVVQQADGKLVVGGLAQNGQGIFVALARFAQ